MTTHITRLENGFFQENSWNNCTLIATLNYFQAKRSLPVEEANAIIQRWAGLVIKDLTRNFTSPAKFPQIVEKLTDGKYLGKLIGKDAINYLRERGISSPEKYAIEQLNGHLKFPLINIYQADEQDLHAVVALRRKIGHTYKIVNNGRIEEREALPRTFFQYQIEPFFQIHQEVKSQRTITPLEEFFLRLSRGKQ